MVQQGVGPFGEPTPATTVSVVRADLENDALFVAQSIPTTMTAGQQYASSITMKNTGILTWTRSAAYRLGSQNPRDNLTWGIGRVELPLSVAQVLPGEHATFAFSVTAPSTAVTYNFQWKMVREGVEWFGDPTPNLQITVTDVSSPSSPIL